MTTDADIHWDAREKDVVTWCCQGVGLTTPSDYTGRCQATVHRPCARRQLTSPAPGERAEPGGTGLRCWHRNVIPARRPLRARCVYQWTLSSQKKVHTRTSSDDGRSLSSLSASVTRLGESVWWCGVVLSSTCMRHRKKELSEKRKSPTRRLDSARVRTSPEWTDP